MGVNGYGVCTWIFGNQPLATTAGAIAGLGYDGVELLGDRDTLDPATAIQVLTANGLRVLSMTPMNVDLAHPSAWVRREALDYYYWLLETAAGLGSPLISCHGAVGRIRSVAGQEAERDFLVQGIRLVAERARLLGLRVALELLNRYESHLLNSVANGLAVLDRIACDSAGLNLDSYHMNVEEPDPASAIKVAGSRLFLYHAADSNRQGVGRGHTDFALQLQALAEIAYCGPVILECAAPGPDPFRPIKDETSLPWVATYLRESLARLKGMMAQA